MNSCTITTNRYSETSSPHLFHFTYLIKNLFLTLSFRLLFFSSRGIYSKFNMMRATTNRKCSYKHSRRLNFGIFIMQRRKRCISARKRREVVELRIFVKKQVFRLAWKFPRRINEVSFNAGGGAFALNVSSLVRVHCEKARVSKRQEGKNYRDKEAVGEKMATSVGLIFVSSVCSLQLPPIADLARTKTRIRMQPESRSRGTPGSWGQYALWSVPLCSPLACYCACSLEGREEGSAGSVSIALFTGIFTPWVLFRVSRCSVSCARLLMLNTTWKNVSLVGFVLLCSESLNFSEITSS